MSTQAIKKSKESFTETPTQAIALQVFGNSVSLPALQKCINDASSTMGRYSVDAEKMGYGKSVSTATAESVLVAQEGAIKKVSAANVTALRESHANGHLTKQELAEAISKEHAKRDLALFGNRLIDALALVNLAVRKRKA